MDRQRINDAVELGARIRERRKELRMSQEEVAHVSQVTTRVMSELERGKPGAQYATISRVLAALGLDLYVRPR
jgi:transcriptional regulator with XRE-family HTH domain